ncbi:hypothetical protein AGR4A_pAt30054 [Agrobacterium tumefaciens str. B6]|uniref:Uncharacterized protein n=1 Tax=Agrobacterium tumefaciens str. B6 TaxID=1183423 RepID=A0A822VCA1_AGRTU|nr:hypothetical protein AGR4A_pAt30054 [Agrobacterium tumefaciens str. B6]
MSSAGVTDDTATVGGIPWQLLVAARLLAARLGGNPPIVNSGQIRMRDTVIGAHLVIGLIDPTTTHS